MKIPTSDNHRHCVMLRSTNRSSRNLGFDHARLRRACVYDDFPAYARVHTRVCVRRYHHNGDIDRLIRRVRRQSTYFFSKLHSDKSSFVSDDNPVRDDALYLTAKWPESDYYHVSPRKVMQFIPRAPPPVPVPSPHPPSCLLRALTWGRFRLEFSHAGRITCLRI